MNNFLPNGAVLPSGLMSVGAYSMMDAYKKTFANYSLKPGIVIQSYAPTDLKNINKKDLEYDVMTFEQDGNQSSTVTTYKNCTVMSAFGSIADFFEANIRKIESNTQGTTPNPSGQNGSIVLLLCINGISDKGVIVGCLSHPDRPTQLTNTEPHLVGEYNGVNIEIKPDGSATLTFNSATNNDGDPIKPLSSPTVVTISDRGAVTISAPQQSVTINCQNANVIATDTAIVDGKTVKLGANAVESVIKGDTFKAAYITHTHPTVFGPSGPPIQPFPPTGLSTKVKTE